MRLIAQLQYRENYGSPEKPHWKNKGGHEIEVAILTPEQVCELGRDGMKKMVVDALPHMEYSNPMSTMHFVDWDIIDGLTEDERFQEEYEGRIIYPAEKLADRIRLNTIRDEMEAAG